MSEKYVHTNYDGNSSNRLPKILKNDIRRFLPGMFANSINSGDFRHVQNFLFSFLVQQCTFNAEVTFPSLFHIPSNVNIAGAQLFSHYFLGWHVMFPDTTFRVKDSRIVTASQYSGSRIEMDIEFQLTKTAHVPLELWMPPIERTSLLYQCRNLQDMLYAVHCPALSPPSSTGGVYAAEYSDYYYPASHPQQQGLCAACSNPPSITSVDVQQHRAGKRGATHTGTENHEDESEFNRAKQRSKPTAGAATIVNPAMEASALGPLSDPSTSTATVITSTSTITSRGTSFGDSTISGLTTTATSSSVRSISQSPEIPAVMATARTGTSNAPTSQVSNTIPTAYLQCSADRTSSPAGAQPSTSNPADCLLLSALPFLAPAPSDTGFYAPTPPLSTQMRIPDRFVDDLHAAAVLLHSPLPLRLVGQYVLYLNESNHIVHITLSAAPV